MRNDPFGKDWYMYLFGTICKWDSEILMNDEAERIVLNTKGCKDKEGHEVSESVKELLAYMEGKAPKSDYRWVEQLLPDDRERIRRARR